MIRSRLTTKEENDLLKEMFTLISATNPSNPIYDVPSYINGFTTALILIRDLEGINVTPS